MNNAAALGGCGGGGLLMRFLGQIVLTKSSRAGGESRKKEWEGEAVGEMAGSGMCFEYYF